MANTEDYLDGLLDSITQAKNEDNRPNDRGTRNRSRREERRGRSRVRPDDDFMEATGLNSYRREQKRNRRERRHSEEDFLRSFEDELSMGDADEVIRSFERELRSDADDEFRLDDEMDSPDADDDDDFFANGLLDEDEEEQSPADAVLSGIANIVSEAKRVATGGDDILPETDDSADDIPIETAEASPAGDEEVPLDIPTDISIGEDTSAQEVPLMDESGEGMDLMDMLAGEGEGDLMDIGDLLTSDEEATELEEGREAFEAAAEGVAEGGEGVEGSEDSEGASAEGASGGSGEAGESGEEGEEAKPNIIQKILGAVTGIFKKKEGEEDDEDEDEEDDEDEDEDEEGGETKEEKKARLKKEKEEAKKKKKEEADAKKKAKEEEKKKKAEEKKKKQAEKAAKPKKKKKPKERSPKIPIPVIIVFLLFAFSIVGSVNIMTNVLGYQVQISAANKAYDKKEYSDAYGILMGRSDLDGDAKKLRNRAKLMAYMQTKQNEYLVCMDSGQETESGLDLYSIRSNYQMALDSLISGVYFFQQNEEKANELGITEEYGEYGQMLEKELNKRFSMTVGEAVDLYRNNTRKDYTAALQKIIRDAGLEERY